MIPIESSMFGSHCKLFFACINIMKMCFFTWKKWFISSRKKVTLFISKVSVIYDYSSAIFFMFRVDKSNDGYASYTELVKFGKMLVRLRFFSLSWSEMKYYWLLLGRNPRYRGCRYRSRESCFKYVCSLWPWQKTKNKQGPIHRKVFGNICLLLFFLRKRLDVSC